jgi:hypothetical protein
MKACVLDALRKAGTPPEIAYAYRKTDLLSLGGDMTLWPKDRVKEWLAAVAEYHLIEQARKDRGPTPEGWDTEIPELLVSPFSQEDFRPGSGLPEGDGTNRGQPTHEARGPHRARGCRAGDSVRARL